MPSRVRRQRRHDRVLDFLAAERRRAVERDDGAVDAERRRRAGDQQQIAGAAFDDLFQPRRAGERVCSSGAVGALRRAGVQLGDERVEIVVLRHTRGGAARDHRLQPFERAAR